MRNFLIEHSQVGFLDSGFIACPISQVMVDKRRDYGSSQCPFQIRKGAHSPKKPFMCDPEFDRRD
jgi:hypothetical protein